MTIMSAHLGRAFGMVPGPVPSPGCVIWRNTHSSQKLPEEGTVSLVLGEETELEGLFVQGRSQSQ